MSLPLNAVRSGLGKRGPHPAISKLLKGLTDSGGLLSRCCKIQAWVNFESGVLLLFADLKMWALIISTRIQLRNKLDWLWSSKTSRTIKFILSLFLWLGQNVSRQSPRDWFKSVEWSLRLCMKQNIFGCWLFAQMNFHLYQPDLHLTTSKIFGIK